MSSAQKTLEVQCKVRRNAEELQNQLNDLYNWEKEIKEKELDLKRLPCDEGKPVDSLRPLRSQNLENKDINANEDKANGEASSKATTPTEKVDLPVDEKAQRHKEANDMKDRGNNFVKLQKFDDAIEAYTAAINVYKEDPVYYSNRALCYLKKEIYEACIDDCDSALEIDKLCVKAYYRRMQANESLGNNMDALKDCTTVLTIEPKNPEAKQSLQRINSRLRQNAPVINGPNFTKSRDDLVDILPIDKPVYKRSKRPLRRVPITDIVAPKSTASDSSPLRISDEDIDKIFNSNCGPFEEVKKAVVSKSDITITKSTPENTKEETKKPASANTPKPIPQTIPHDSTAVKPQQPHIAEVPLKNQQQKQQHQQQLRDQKQQLKHTDDDNLRPLPPAPTSTAQFYTHWKELTAVQKYKYLKSIEISKLCKILGAGFDSDTLTSLMDTLNNYYIPNKESTLAKTLLEISKNLQVPILSMLMSCDERKVLNDIVDSLKNDVKADDAVVTAICHNFGLC